jgi:hypothetical protein
MAELQNFPPSFLVTMAGIEKVPGKYILQGKAVGDRKREVPGGRTAEGVRYPTRWVRNP